MPILNHCSIGHMVRAGKCNNPTWSLHTIQNPLYDRLWFYLPLSVDYVAYLMRPKMYNEGQKTLWFHYETVLGRFTVLVLSGPAWAWSAIYHILLIIDSDYIYTSLYFGVSNSTQFIIDRSIHMVLCHLKFKCTVSNEDSSGPRPIYQRNRAVYTATWNCRKSFSFLVPHTKQEAFWFSWYVSQSNILN